MIEKTLAQLLERIFELKVTFSAPSESQEQECVFVEIEQSRSAIRDTIETAKVTGRLRVYVNSAKMPLGYIAKCIAKADPADTKDLFFYDVETSSPTFNNLVERSLSFVYFYKAQYNPDRGEIDSVNLTVEVDV